jgi:di/tricarboxylate transporter
MYLLASSVHTCPLLRTLMLTLPLPPPGPALLLPRGRRPRHHSHLLAGLLQWESAVDALPLGVVLLLGGGAALSYGLTATGAAARAADAFAAAAMSTSSTGASSSTLGLGLILALACPFVMLAANVMSNVAAANVVLAALPCLAVSLGYSPTVSAV